MVTGLPGGLNKTRGRIPPLIAPTITSAERAATSRAVGDDESVERDPLFDDPIAYRRRHATGSVFTKKGCVRSSVSLVDMLVGRGRAGADRP